MVRPQGSPSGFLLFKPENTIDKWEKFMYFVNVIEFDRSLTL